MPAGFPPFSTLFHRLIHIIVNCDSLFPERFPVACQNLRLKTCTTLLHIFHEKVYYNKNPSLNEGFLLSNFSILSVLCNDSSGLSYRNINRKSGVLRGIRTPDLLVRSQTLYPAELVAHIFIKSGGEQGIRTPDTGFCPYTRLAGERLRPTRPTLHVKCVNGGEGGIRTHDTLLCDGFQDRSVMTTSVPLHGNAPINHA